MNGADAPAEPAADPDPLDAVLDQWHRELRVLERTGPPWRADDLRRRIEEVRDARSRAPQKWLGISGAVDYSGYSRDHLRDLAAADEIVAKKDGGRWRFLRSSLPRKPRSPDPGERPSERAARRALSDR